MVRYAAVSCPVLPGDSTTASTWEATLEWTRSMDHADYPSQTLYAPTPCSGAQWDPFQSSGYRRLHVDIWESPIFSTSFSASCFDLGLPRRSVATRAWNMRMPSVLLERLATQGPTASDPDENKISCIPQCPFRTSCYLASAAPSVPGFGAFFNDSACRHTPSLGALPKGLPFQSVQREPSCWPGAYEAQPPRLLCGRFSPLAHYEDSANGVVACAAAMVSMFVQTLKAPASAGPPVS